MMIKKKKKTVESLDLIKTLRHFSHLLHENKFNRQNYDKTISLMFFFIYDLIQHFCIHNAMFVLRFYVNFYHTRGLRLVGL